MSSHKRPLSPSEAMTDKPATSKRPTQARKPKEKPLFERTNALPLPQFSARYFPPNTTAETIQSSTNVHLTLTTWTEMPSPLREACINLLELTSRSDYHASEKGWSKSKKLKEMRHPAMKYLLLLPLPLPLPLLPVEGKDKDKAAHLDPIAGFLSFMITEEDGHEVVYCYELHLQPGLQGKGVGRRMMELMEMIGERVGVEKAMLTVFRSNQRAVKAYGSWGYGVDEFSPEARKLRDGTVKEPSYVILSKERWEFAKEERSQEQTDACGFLRVADKHDIYEAE